jgi:hypothetical protein
MQLARRGSQWSLGHFSRGSSFDAHGHSFHDAPRTDRARITPERKHRSLCVLAYRDLTISVTFADPILVSASAIAYAYRRAALMRAVVVGAASVMDGLPCVGAVGVRRVFVIVDHSEQSRRPARSTPDAR